MERVRSVAPDVLKSLLRIGTRQTAQRKQTRHETDLGVRVARLNELRHLVELREVSRLASGRQLYDVMTLP